MEKDDFLLKACEALQIHEDELSSNIDMSSSPEEIVSFAEQYEDSYILTQYAFDILRKKMSKATLEELDELSVPWQTVRDLVTKARTLNNVPTLDIPQ